MRATFRRSARGCPVSTQKLKQRASSERSTARSAHRVEVLDAGLVASTVTPNRSSRKTTSFSVLIESRMPPVISGVSLGQLARVFAGQELAEDVVAERPF